MTHLKLSLCLIEIYNNIIITIMEDGIFRVLQDNALSLERIKASGKAFILLGDIKFCTLLRNQKNSEFERSVKIKQCDLSCN